MSKTVAIFYQKEQKFSMVSPIISAMYCYRSLYMNQIPGIYYLYARLIKQKCIRIPLLYSKRIDSGIKNQYAIKAKSNLLEKSDALLLKLLKLLYTISLILSVLQK